MIGYFFQNSVFKAVNRGESVNPRAVFLPTSVTGPPQRKKNKPPGQTSLFSTANKSVAGPLQRQFRAKLSSSMDFLVTGPPQRNSSQIVVFFWFFNRPGSSATSNNSASTSDNGDKISSQCPKGFLSGLPISSQMSKGFSVGSAARLRSTKEKKRVLC